MVQTKLSLVFVLVAAAIEPSISLPVKGFHVADKIEWWRRKNEVSTSSRTSSTSSLPPVIPPFKSVLPAKGSKESFISLPHLRNDSPVSGQVSRQGSLSSQASHGSHSSEASHGSHPSQASQGSLLNHVSHDGSSGWSLAQTTGSITKHGPFSPYNSAAYLKTFDENSALHQTARDSPPHRDKALPPLPTSDLPPH